jgi:hypothetical protein
VSSNWPPSPKALSRIYATPLASLWEGYPSKVYMKRQVQYREYLTAQSYRCQNRRPEPLANHPSKTFSFPSTLPLWKDQAYQSPVTEAACVMSGRGFKRSCHRLRPPCNCSLFRPSHKVTSRRLVCRPHSLGHLPSSETLFNSS